MPVEPEPLADAVAITLTPDTAEFGTPAFTLTVTAAAPAFTEESGIAFAGGSKVTTYISSTQVSCIVDWSVITAPGVMAVWVVTDGVSTLPADFTATEPTPPGPDPTPENDLLTAQLQSWGFSGEPVRWAPSDWQPVVFAIRAANTGFGTQATVQGLLDTTFPGQELLASEICLAVLPDATISSAPGQDPGTVVLSVPHMVKLPVQNTSWTVDGTQRFYGSSTPELPLEPGDHVAESNVAVGGVVYRDTMVGTVKEVDAPTSRGAKYASDAPAPKVLVFERAE